MILKTLSFFALAYLSTILVIDDLAKRSKILKACSTHNQKN